ncbi:MAG: AAA family ATPase, partial [Lachnospiraceae bacterium]|nr:AAA family ATPase [Lachnospiraceae bacterium]
RYFKGEYSMASWKLFVENYGKIKSAEIEMAPLTFFVGDNNSGKSFLLSLLWGIENLGIETFLLKGINVRYKPL